jgi:hypothetical protein
MPATLLQQLHDATIEVELEIAGTLRNFRGKGIYEEGDPDLGPTLKVQVSDPDGDFELFFPEATCRERVRKSDRPGCEYRISLAGAATP